MNDPSRSVGTTTRRQFLGVEPAARQHIASLIVQAWPDRLAHLQPLLNRIPGVETHGSDAAGKLVVTVEAESDAHLVELIGAIEAAEGVITASLVYHQLEEADHG